MNNTKALDSEQVLRERLQETLITSLNCAIVYGILLEQLNQFLAQGKLVEAQQLLELNRRNELPKEVYEEAENRLREALHYVEYYVPED